MKRLIMVLFIALAFSVVASAQVRIDLGIDVPLSVGAVAEGIGLVGDPLDLPVTLPFPSAGLYYRLGDGGLRFGVGARMYSLVFISLVWPNAFVELELGPVVLAGQVGGGAFFMFGLLGNRTEFGQVFMPDVSAWFKLGDTFRVGAGAIGLFLPDVTSEALPVVFYLGVKAAMNL
ncbi:MAG: hypothetical protein A2087_01830 [Spirochaetes bacterium GWD1_61_31]|nr:MAG: hypothetical protein A2Y37_11560 [Spirochaetes bacterium GWB1_60_80]OHD29906.1 MAG: hypothetical protein A2004_11800 [Spirochaetes bacterium GWC1_61_12]OHD43763.1 MAG: hypothetical protein A2087_01830 [Spirochaetes bacterium GWD1_61_31]OHD46005.1 MAG: hypothetical protein A2Y35_13385 [Spirochaetes bacterium GWE1_60_18]OHD60577.1 MAG: hypothetical protein A2Y32_07875 [Spirochaetes bacterium GWF1_60_12]HAP43413.1 hypothetical protein [Spirochaetaceae bacterium]